MIVHLWTLLGLLILSFEAMASPASFVYQGQIIKSNSKPLEDSHVVFTVQILSPGSEQCLLYEETHTVNMTDSKGLFSLSIGEGNRSGVAYHNTSTLIDSFNNTLPTQTPSQCVSIGSYTPSSIDQRILRLTFDTGSGPVTVSQDQRIQSVPFAQHAATVGGRTVDDFLLNNTSVGYELSQNNIETIFESSNYTELLALLAGTSSLYMGSSPSTAPNFNGLVLDNIADPIDDNDAANRNYVDSNIGGASADSTFISNLGALESGYVLVWNGTEWTASTPAADSTKLALAGGTMVGSINMGNNNIINANNVALNNNLSVGQGLAVGSTVTVSGGIGVGTGINSGGTIALEDGNELHFLDNDSSNYVGLKAPATVSANFVLTLPTVPGIANQALISDGSGNLVWSSGGVGDITAVATGSGLTGGGSAGDVTISVANSGITSAMIADGTIATADLADSSVNSNKIVDGSVSLIDMADNSINSAKIVDGSVGTVDLTNTSVTNAKLADNSVNSDKIVDSSVALVDMADNSINSAKIMDGSVGTVDLANTSVTNAKLADNSVNSAKIVDGSIAIADLNTASIDTRYVNQSGDSMTGSLILNGQNEVRFADSDSSNYVAFRAPTTVTSNVLYTLPDADSSVSGYVLSTNAAGSLSWAPPAAPPDNMGNHTAGQNVRLNNYWLSNDGGNEGIRIDNSGNIGIGTANPTNPLQVEGRIRASTLMLDDGSFANPSIVYPGSSNSGIFFSPSGPSIKVAGNLTTVFANNAISMNGIGTPYMQRPSSTSTPAYAFGGRSDTGMYSPADAVLGFSTGGTEKVRIDGSGNVGIGTTSPAAKLTVNGGATFDVSAGGSNGQVLITSHGSVAGQGGLMFSQNTNYGATSEGFKFYTTGTGTIGSGRFYLGKVVNNAPDSITDLLTVQSNGNVGIGTNPTQKLHVNGQVLASGYFHTSDRRLKTNIREVEGLDFIRLLRGVRFQWKSDSTEDVGFIAQEVEEIAPELVSTGSDGVKSVKYSSLTSPLVEAVKELDKICIDQSREIQSLKDENKNLKDRLEMLEKSLMHLESLVRKK